MANNIFADREADDKLGKVEQAMGNRDPSVRDWVPPRHPDLINTGESLAPGSHRGIDRCGVEIHARARTSCRDRWLERRVAKAQGVSERTDHLHWIAMPSYMHEPDCRAGAQKMVMKRRYLDTTFKQLSHDGIDLGISQHQIAHHHRAVVSRRKRNVATKCCGLYRNAIDCQPEIEPGDGIEVNFAWP
jgi:hypothetical protein